MHIWYLFKIKSKDHNFEQILYQTYFWLHEFLEGKYLFKFSLLQWMLWLNLLAFNKKNFNRKNFN